MSISNTSNTSNTSPQKLMRLTEHRHGDYFGPRAMCPDCSASRHGRALVAVGKISDSSTVLDAVVKDIAALDSLAKTAGMELSEIRKARANYLKNACEEVFGISDWDVLELTLGDTLLFGDRVVLTESMTWDSAGMGSITGERWDKDILIPANTFGVVTGVDDPLGDICEVVFDLYWAPRPNQKVEVYVDKSHVVTLYPHHQTDESIRKTIRDFIEGLFSDFMKEPEDPFTLNLDQLVDECFYHAATLDLKLTDDELFRWFKHAYPPIQDPRQIWYMQQIKPR